VIGLENLDQQLKRSLRIHRQHTSLSIASI